MSSSAPKKGSAGKWIALGVAVAVVLVAIAMGRRQEKKSPPPPSGTASSQTGQAPQPPVDVGCVDIEPGEYRATYNISCGMRGNVWAKVKQNGCDVEMTLPILGSLKGKLQGDGATYELTFFDPCTGSATGTFTVIRGTGITGTFNGRSFGKRTLRCCDPVTGTFQVLLKQKG